MATLLASGATNSTLFSRLLVEAEYTFQDPATDPADFPKLTVDARFSGQAQNLLSSVAINLLAVLAASGEFDRAYSSLIPAPTKDQKVKLVFHVPLFPSSYQNSGGDNCTVSWTTPTGWTMTIRGIDPITSPEQGKQASYIVYSRSTLNAGNNPLPSDRYAITIDGVTQIQQLMFPRPVISTPKELFWQSFYTGELPNNFITADYDRLYQFLGTVYGQGTANLSSTGTVSVLQSSKYNY